MQRIQVEVTLSELRCLFSNELSDEPYLWTFFVKLDGDTISLPPGSLSFASNIHVHSPAGSHGNLNATGIKSGRRVAIPAHLGVFATSLRPIEVTYLGRTLYVPGQLVAAAALLEEDASPSNSRMEEIHEEVRQFFESEARAFIADLNVTDVVNEALDLQRDEQESPLLTISGLDASYLDRVIQTRVEALRGRLRDGAKQIAQIGILASHTPGFFWEILDVDDYLGYTMLRFGERLLLDSDQGSVLPIERGHPSNPPNGVAIQRKNGAQYALFGSVNTSLIPNIYSLQVSGGLLSSSVGTSGSHTFTANEAGLCVFEGRTADWQRVDQREQYTALFHHPFLDLEWVLGAKRLEPPSGSVTIAVESRFPSFDPAHPGAPFYTHGNVAAVIDYDHFRSQEGLPGIRIRNRPEDGVYALDLQVFGVLTANAPAHLQQRKRMNEALLQFEGQRIASPFFDSYKKCIDQFKSKLYLDMKRVGPKELWGPGQRIEWYEEQVRIGEQLVEARLVTPERFDAAKTALRRQLRIDDTRGRTTPESRPL